MPITPTYPGVYVQETNSEPDPVFEPPAEAAADLAAALHFAVDFGDGQPVAFAEVGGLTAHSLTVSMTIVEGSEASAPVPAMALSTAGNVILMGGSLPPGPALAFCRQVLGDLVGHAVEPRNVFITLVGPNARALRTWELKAAWPVKVTGDLDASPAVIEALDLACESITVADDEPPPSQGGPRNG